ncbi:flagellar export chaperone FliS [Alicyclobacillus pomorum]|uniref:flagellar export chaperone FliS n=1 Tax=Alicyclobacillus pomorum TaxID=204470 RepID=UPI0004250B8F|nr:flagellar export chaperone FliS [Alicyclobacillus pomorum]
MSVNPQAYARYKAMSVQTASPDRLLIMLYDGLLLAMRSAKEQILASNLPEAHRQLVKAQDIVHELRNTLKMEYEISHALAALYEYFLRRLTEANVKKAVHPIDEIYPRVEELREAWVQASMKLRTEAAMPVSSAE